MKNNHTWYYVEIRNVDGNGWSQFKAKGYLDADGGFTVESGSGYLSKTEWKASTLPDDVVMLVSHDHFGRLRLAAEREHIAAFAEKHGYNIVRSSKIEPQLGVLPLLQQEKEPFIEGVIDVHADAESDSLPQKSTSLEDSGRPGNFRIFYQRWSALFVELIERIGRIRTMLRPGRYDSLEADARPYFNTQQTAHDSEAPAPEPPVP